MVLTTGHFKSRKLLTKDKMKFITMKSKSWAVAMAMLALPGALVTSCSKDTATEQVAPKGDKLTISVKGINNTTSTGALRQSSGTKTTSTSALQYKVHEFSDVDVAVSVGNKLPVKSTRAVGNGKSGNAFRAAVAEELEAIAEGAKYVLYLYDSQTEEFATSVVLDSETEGTVGGLDLSKSYKWVAISYNDATNTPEVAVDGSSIDLDENVDVLYASGEVDLAADPAISITFDHAFARIGVELNTIGVFGTIDDATISVDGLQLTTGSIDLFSGALTPNSTTFTPQIDYANFVSVDGVNQDAKIAYVYTAPSTATSFTVNVKDLDITHVDNIGGVTQRTFFSAAAGGDFTFNITPEAGKNHHVALNVVESPLTTYLGRKNIFGQMQNQVTVKWGRSNLYYRGEGDDRNYAFYANNDQKRRADGYFAFEGLEPMSLGSSVEGGDPCALVYPAGLWKTPTVTEVNSITTSSGVLGNVLGGILDAVAANPTQGTDNSPMGAQYVQYDITAGGTSSSNAFGNATSNSNNLRIFKNGQITNASVLTAIGDNGLLGLGLSDLSVDLLDVNILGTTISVLGDSYNRSGGLWTSSRLLSGSLLDLLGTSVGSQGYHVYQSAALIGGPFIKATTTAELLGNVDALGIDIANVSLKNVRCVRAN